jgi:hypothetical protein
MRVQKIGEIRQVCLYRSVLKKAMQLQHNFIADGVECRVSQQFLEYFSNARKFCNWSIVCNIALGPFFVDWGENFHSFGKTLSSRHVAKIR